METTPVVLSDLIYDTESRAFYSDQLPLYPINRADGTPFLFSPSIQIPEEEITVIDRPTYIMYHFHSCFGHAYVDLCIPILSILHEYDEDCLKRRGFQLFIFKELYHDVNPSEYNISYFKDWESKMVDYKNGTLNKAYNVFHRACSDTPILFEKHLSSKRFIKFKTAIYGGYYNFQRSIHNSSKRYPGRIDVESTATDEQILNWIHQGKLALSRTLSLLPEPSSNSPILFLARKESRTFDEGSIEILSHILNTGPTYFEDIPFKDQIEAFRSADIIVSPHGSALFHLIWCKPGTRILEIFATDDPRSIMFKSYCDVLGLNYTAINCSSKKEQTDEMIHLPSDAISRIHELVSERLTQSSQPSSA